MSIYIYYFKQRYNDCFYKTLFLILFYQSLSVTQMINLQPLYLFSLVNRLRSRHYCQKPNIDAATPITYQYITGVANKLIIRWPGSCGSSTHPQGRHLLEHIQPKPSSN